MELPVRGFYAGADVEAITATDGAGRQVECAHHVFNINIVAGIAAIAKNGGGVTVQESLGENRHHTGLTVRVLARTIHIRGGYV